MKNLTKLFILVFSLFIISITAKAETGKTMVGFLYQLTECNSSFGVFECQGLAYENGRYQAYGKVQFNGITTFWVFEIRDDWVLQVKTDNNGIIIFIEWEDSSSLIPGGCLHHGFQF